MLSLEKNLGYNGDGMSGDYGFDNITLGWAGTNGPTVDKGIVSAYINQTFWLGTFGLNPAATNFTTLNDPKTSYMRSLKASNFIPSLAYGYTAGAIYRLNAVFGSLTLGGYDAARFTATNVTFPFYEDINKDLLVNVQSIRLESRGSSLGTYETSFAAYIDSTLPFLYLPEAACKVFESAFKLTWNATTKYYVVDSSLHESLVQQDPTVTLTLGPQISGGPTVVIPMPYSAFDLNVTYWNSPLVTRNTTAPVGYFPLRRATDPTQYTLGRTFLQEAYLIADYDRGNFTVAPCKWDAGTTQQKIRSILSPDLQKIQDDADAAAASSKKLSGGAIAGIVVGVLALIAIIVGLIVFFIVRKRRKNRNGDHPDQTQPLRPHAPEEKGDGTFYGGGKGELNGTPLHEMSSGKHGSGGGASEVAADESSAFLAKYRRDEKTELEGSRGDYFGRGKPELPGSSPGVYEMEAGLHHPAHAPPPVTRHDPHGLVSPMVVTPATSGGTRALTPPPPVPGGENGHAGHAGHFRENLSTSPPPPVSPLRPDHDPKSGGK